MKINQYLLIIAIVYCNGIFCPTLRAMSTEDMVRGLQIHETTLRQHPTKGTRGIKGTVTLPKQRKQLAYEQSAAELALQLQFGLDSASLTSTAILELRKLAAALEDTSLRDYKFQIEGHTCDLGSAAHNMQLSKRRAYAVADWLTNHTSLSPEQFEVLWFGESRPIVANTDEDSRKKNRRVVVRNTGEIPEVSLQKKPATLEIVRYSGSNQEIIADGDSLSSGGKYAISFTSANKPYAYVCQMDASGKTEVLFPNAKFSPQANPIQPGVRYTIPSNVKAFYLDQTTGKEQIIVLALDRPLYNPKLACETVLNKPTVAERGVGGVSSAPPVEQIKPAGKEVDETLNLCETLYGGKTRGYTASTRGLGGIAPAESSPASAGSPADDSCQGFILKRFFYHQ